MTITIDPESMKQLCLLALGFATFGTLLALLAFVVIMTISDWFNSK